MQESAGSVLLGVRAHDSTEPVRATAGTQMPHPGLPWASCMTLSELGFPVLESQRCRSSDTQFQPSCSDMGSFMLYLKMYFCLGSQHGLLGRKGICHQVQSGKMYPLTLGDKDSCETGDDHRLLQCKTIHMSPPHLVPSNSSKDNFLGQLLLYGSIINVLSLFTSWVSN